MHGLIKASGVKIADRCESDKIIMYLKISCTCKISEWHKGTEIIHNSMQVKIGCGTYSALNGCMAIDS